MKVLKSILNFMHNNLIFNIVMLCSGIFVVISRILDGTLSIGYFIFEAMIMYIFINNIVRIRQESKLDPIEKDE